MNLFKKRIIAGLLAVTMVVSSLQISTYEVYAEELSEETSDVMAETEEEAPSSLDISEEESPYENVEAADLSDIYQFGGAPSREALEAAEPSLSIESDNLADEVEGLTVEEYIYRQMMAKNENIDISAFNVTYSGAKFISDIVHGVINDNPSLYFVKPIQYWNNGKIYTVINVAYDDSYIVENFEKETKTALSFVDNQMSDLQKAIILHDYLAVNCAYDYDNYLNGHIPDASYNAYGVLVEGKAVCQGYALAYKYLLNQVGIECYMVTSDVMNHAWNLIKLDGEYYQVDVTWDDPVWDLTGRARHLYMFLSDDTFALTGDEDPNKRHRNWEVTSGSKVVDYKATDDKYDSAFWANSNAPFVLTGDDWNTCYYVNYDTKGVINQTELSDISDKGETIYEFESWGWKNTYSGLFQYNGRLYFNDKTSIRSMALDDISDNRVEFTPETSSGNYIFGSALCRGKVLYSLHTTPNITETETVYEANINGIETEEPEVTLVDKIELDKYTLTLEEGETAELTATVSPAESTYTNVIWKSSDSSIAEVKSGVVTAVSAGSCTITASVGDVKAICSVTVKSGSTDIPVEGIELHPTELTLKVGEASELEAAVTPENATNAAITWESSNPLIAEVESATNKSVVVRALSKGNCTITVSSCGVEAVCNVIVIANEKNDNIAEGSYEGIRWVIDKNYKLTVDGNGDFAEPTGDNDYYYMEDRAPWYGYEIKSAEVNVTGMTDASFMFAYCHDLIDVDFRNFDTSEVTNMSGMFEGCSSLTSLDLSDLDTGHVTNISGIFSGCESITNMDFLRSIDTRNVTDMSRVFSGCDKLTSVDFSGIDTQNVTNMSGMFYGCSSLISADLSEADARNITNMSKMFYNCVDMVNLNIRGIYTPYLTDMSEMFYSCRKLTSLDISGIDTRNVSNMSGMFERCGSLTSMDFSNLYFTTPVNMNGMFYSCSSLINVEFGDSNICVSDISRMFDYCENLTSIDLSNIDLGSMNDGNVNNSTTLFNGCGSLIRINSPHSVRLRLYLPKRTGEYWVRSDNGETVEYLPTDLSYSVLLVIKKDPNDQGTEDQPIPTDAYITVSKLKTGYIISETLNTDDLTVTYYDSLGAASEVVRYTTNADEIDMSTAGTKELTVTYKELTASVNIYVTSGNREGIKVEFADPHKAYIYTGKAITPKIKVTNNGEPLTEGTDYTVKYSNNVKASESAKVVVTGKGNMFKSYTKVFIIQRKQLDNTDLINRDVAPDAVAAPMVEGDYVTVVEGAKISPVLMYNGMKLTAKDFKVTDEYKNYKWKLEDKDDNSKKTITVTGQGNYQGTRTLAVKVISKAEQNNVKLIVSIGKDAKKITYDGEPKDIAALGLLTVSTKNTPASELKEAKDGKDGDYVIYYPDDITGAGTKKFTITGISERCMGTVTKSFAIKPKKADFIVTYDEDNRGYDFVSTGTKVGDLVVKDGETVLDEGIDYKVTYSGNKKAGNTAKFTITGIGSYKGSKCTKTFTINKGVLNNNAKSIAERTKNLEIAVADKVFNKAGIYKSAPYVSIDGVQLKASNYTVTYYLDNPAVNSNPRVMDGKNKVTRGETTVWVKIIGKGNYATTDDTCYVTASYRVRSLASSDSYDLSKASVTFRDKDGNPIKKIEYTGEPITGDDIKVVVTYKIGKETYTLGETNDYTLTFINNVNKGKATVLITGRPGQSGYVGSKTASFSITAGNLSNVLSNTAG
ncbi:MAG: BspA family leucine-rich repeat surface protein [Lachnospiraceae bacterium]|nr:BspA family leucine-rich repeat surface protein [Lachnospiraceae bacterium]